MPADEFLLLFRLKHKIFFVFLRHIARAIYFLDKV